MSDISAVSVLEEAKALLIRDGWIKNSPRNQRGQHCTFGAIEDVVYEHVASNYRHAPLETAGLQLQAAIVQLGGKLSSCCYHCTISEWNDASKRTFNEITEAFDRAILIAKEAEANTK